MNPVHLRRIVAATVVATLLTVPAMAQRSRSASHPAAKDKFVVTVTGTVLDDVTGLPVRNAEVSATFSGATDANGKFRLRNVTAYGAIQIKVGRTGYVTKTHTLKINESPDLTFRLTPTKTVSVRRTDGTTVALDIESVKFGYSPLFAGHVEIHEVCKSDGTKLPLDYAQMSRVTGPGVVAGSGPCCNSSITKIPLTLKNGQTFDIFFSDSCAETNKSDFSGRDHVGGSVVYLLLTDIAEIVFPN